MLLIHGSLPAPLAQSEKALSSKSPSCSQKSGGVTASGSIGSTSPPAPGQKDLSGRGGSASGASGPGGRPKPPDAAFRKSLNPLLMIVRVEVSVGVPRTPDWKSRWKAA